MDAHPLRMGFVIGGYDCPLEGYYYESFSQYMATVNSVFAYQLRVNHVCWMS